MGNASANKLKNLALVGVLLLCLFLLFSACSSASETDTEAVDKNTDVVEIPYTGNEIFSSQYTDRTAQNPGCDFSKLYEETVNSVVTVKTTYTSGFFGQTEQTNTGTGFILSEDGYILTSTSLFLNSDDSVLRNFKTQVLHEGKTYDASVIYCDQTIYSSQFPFGQAFSELDNSDLTLIKISDSSASFEPVTIGNSESVYYGEECYSISTFSDEDDDLSGIMTEGIVSRPMSDRSSSFAQSENINFFDGSFEYLIQTSLTTNEGNEGAPLFNESGDVIGIMNLRAEDTQTFLSNDSFGISFAVPSITIKSFLSEVESETGVKVQVSYSDENFTENRSQNLLQDEENIQLVNSSSDKVLQEYIKKGEFVFADESDTIVLKSQTNESADSVGSSAEIAAARMNGTVKIISLSSTTLSEGSGFVITSDGYIITNLHVINKNTASNEDSGQEANSTVDIINTYNFALFDNIKVNGKYLLFSLEIIAYDQKEDMAVLKLKNNFQYLADSGTVNGLENVCRINTQTLSQGQKVVAIGNALGYGLSVTDGIVSVTEMSGYYQSYGHNFIQTDCPINSGNSGGPLFDVNGNVVGINSMGLRSDIDGDGLEDGYENVSWAIPSICIKNFVEEVNQGSVQDGIVLKSVNISASFD